MVEIFDYHIRADNDYSNAGPALGVVGNTPCIAWKGSGNDHPNVMPIVKNPDGTVWFDTERKIIWTSDKAGGGLAIGQKDRNAALMWPSGNGPATLIGNTFDEGMHIVEDLVALGQTTQYAPALCWWIHELNMAWTGEDQRLNVAPLSWGDSGWEFLRERVFTSNETSGYEPALAWRPGPNRLYMAWTGEGAGELNVMYCQGGSWSDPPPERSVFDSATKHTFDHEFSDAGPSIYVVGSSISLAYRGNGNRNINLLQADEDDNYQVVRKRTSGHTTPYKPAYASFWDRHWIAYTGDDEHLYLARVAP
jgi:hypothetical protein